MPRLKGRVTFSLVMLIVAVTVMTVVVTRVDSETDAFPLAMPQQPAPSTSATLAAAVPPSHCALQYAALLDLAQMARNDGVSSDTYRRALHKVSARLNECQADERHAALPPEQGQRQVKDAQKQAYRWADHQADHQPYNRANQHTHPQTYAQETHAPRNPDSPA